MLNGLINIDLHIHTRASRHKELPISAGSDKTIVDNSTKDNLDLLFAKLKENQIAMFSFTDHNVFSADMYNAAKAKIEDNKNQYRADHPELEECEYNGFRDLFPREILPGVEFDVKRKDELKPGHILVIFDPDNKGAIDSIQKRIFSDDDIEKAVSISKIKDSAERKKAIKELDQYSDKIAQSKLDFHLSWKDFQALIKSIGCSAVLIGEQRSEMIETRHYGEGHSDFIDSTESTTEKIQSLGTVSALEYSSPRNESILLRDLKTFDIPEGKALFIGSDCHDWNAYPYHDKNSVVKEKTTGLIMNKPGFPCSVKALPNYKGLLMCATSPKTRFCTNQFNLSPYIESISINGSKVPLSPGINAIVGENGSGKTFVLSSFVNDLESLKKVYKRYCDKNTVEIFNNSSKTQTYISQGELATALKDCGSGIIKALHKENEIGNIDNSCFERTYQQYTDSLFEAISNQIKIEKAIQSLSTKPFEVKTEADKEKPKFIYISYDEDFKSNSNDYTLAQTEISSILSSFNTLNVKTKQVISHLEKEYQDKFNTAVNNIKEISDILKTKAENKDFEIKVRGFIETSIDSYESNVKELMNGPEKASQAYINQKKQIIESVVLVYKLISETSCFEKFPNVIKDGKVSKIYGEISLNKVANYCDVNLKESFNEFMFMAKKADIKNLKEIRTIESFASSIKGCKNVGSLDEIKGKMNENLQKFYDKEEKITEQILDTTDSKNQTQGATPGQQSLNFFKCLASTNDSNHLLLFDQPEDNISPSNITKHLSTYISKLKNTTDGTRQIILVTHSPYLVVNSDADNIICLTSKNQKIEAKSGCLEDDENGIMQFIADNMDGGKRAIEDRLNYYTEVKDDEENN